MSGPCCLDPGAKQTHQARGHVEQIGGINTYKTGQGKSAIVIFTDVFGYSFINIQKVADSFAEGVQATVLIPDLFNEDCIDPNTPNLREKMMTILTPWLEKHPVTDACTTGEKFITTIKEQYHSIQVIGTCYGAKIVIHLLAHPQFSSIIKAGVAAHPSFLVKEEATQIKRPILFLCAETDQSFTPDLRQTFEKELSSNGLGTFIEYPGTQHGFLVRPHGSADVSQQRDKAVQDATQFFKKNL
ncbi:unnamed protein product [Adineta steineri]|uniref:Dienelactone hydrolase domain-containing protein n=1 Tax=Adineta steineri TaxID=433720 RepID=A0A818SFC9_9BILA|nr:unnamed protein product [Adineta steineri]CAF3666636.1 unnamed protein product [Adineta steineri]